MTTTLNKIIVILNRLKTTIILMRQNQRKHGI